MTEQTSQEPTRLVPQVPVPGAQPPLSPPPVQVQRRAPEVVGKKGPFVKYVGPCTKRVIRPHHWAMRLPKEHIKDPNATHTWSMANDKMIPSSEFSDAQLDYLLIDDKQARGGQSFLEVDYDENKQLVQVKQKVG